MSRIISGLDVAGERISELEDISIETSNIKKKRKTEKKKKKPEYSRTLVQLQKV